MRLNGVSVKSTVDRITMLIGLTFLNLYMLEDVMYAKDYLKEITYGN